MILSYFLSRKSQTTTYNYDKINRVIRADYADGSNTAYTYNAVGRLTTVSDSVIGTISYTYSDTGCPSCGGVDKLIQEVTLLGGINYSYDAIGRRTSMTVSGQPAVSYNYDAVSRLIQVAQGTQVVNLGYDAAGRRTNLSYPNGTNSSYFYDNASRLTEILHQGPSGIIEDIRYANDAIGNRISFSRTGSQADLPAEVQAAYNAANQLTNWNNATPNLTYDNNGNLVSKTDSTGTTSYTWDARNRLTAISGPGISANFVYDALGRRISKTINGVTTQYLYDGNDIIAEIQNSTISATYLRSLNIDEPFIRQSTSAEYYHTDALGSALSLTDSTGAVQTTYSYEPFGRVYQRGQSSTNPFQYTGRENDGTGLYYYRARYYSPELQRFISEDPIRFAGRDINFYTYVGNSPVNFVDPYGFFSVDVGGGATVGFFDFTYGYNSGLGASLTNPQFGAGGFVCINICNSPAPPLEGCYGPTIEDEPLEEQPITVSVGVGRRSGVSVTTDLCTICINYGWSWGGLPINIGIPIQIQ